MRLVFRLRYRSEPSQTLWLRLQTSPAAGGPRLGQWVAMRWVDEHHWQAELDVEADSPLRVSHHYQLRQSNGVELDEWGAERERVLDPAEHDGAVFHDTWRSAGGVDHVWECSAFRDGRREGRNVRPVPVREIGDTVIRLHMAAVPAGRVPCVCGDAGSLGCWDWKRAVPLEEIEANHWQVRLALPPDGAFEFKFGLYDPEAGCAVALEEGGNRRVEALSAAERQYTQVSEEGYRRDPRSVFRGAGVAIPVFSLRSRSGLGVGEFADLIPFADWAASAGFKMIQILPVNDTTSAQDWTDSYPYSAISVFALHPLYLRLDDLDPPVAMREEIRVLRESLNACPQVDYEAVMQAKRRLTRCLFEERRGKITGSKRFRDFLREQAAWIGNYAAFCVFRDRFGTADFGRWGELAEYDPARVEGMMAEGHPDWPEMAYHIWLQVELDRQLAAAVDHLRGLGLALKGDLPIGIDRQSVEAWSAPGLFHMEAQAGAPPDAFAAKGQNWGFPTYDWEAMRADGYAWWRSRFEALSRYFDAYRMDHILGFFRIWQIPAGQVEGIMGWFDPALPVHVDEIRSRGIPFDLLRHCRPYLRAHLLPGRFGEMLGEALDGYLEECGDGYYRLRGHVATQREIAGHFAGRIAAEPGVRARLEFLRDRLIECAGEVLFHEVPGSGGQWFHPRCGWADTDSFRELDEEVKWRVEALFVDYFYRRQEDFWQAQGYRKLPAMRRASPMLLCGEDLGMVPACVPGVMRELGILSLEIQRMPKDSSRNFFHPADAPYLSVVSPSTHDMPTLRGWWREDPAVTSRFAWDLFGEPFPAAELDERMAARILEQHFHSPAMWAVIPLQDLLAMDGGLRHPDPDAERINVPAIMPYYWRYRMHLGIEELAAADAFNRGLGGMLAAAGR